MNILEAIAYMQDTDEKVWVRENEYILSKKGDQYFYQVGHDGGPELLPDDSRISWSILTANFVPYEMPRIIQVS